MFGEAEAIVARDPEVLNGGLRFVGTRVPAKNLVDHLASGGTLDDFLDGFPGVSASGPWPTTWRWRARLPKTGRPRAVRRTPGG